METCVQSTGGGQSRPASGDARLLAAADERERGVRGRVACAARARRSRHEEDQAAARPQQPRGRVQQVPRALAWHARAARHSQTLDPRQALPGRQGSAAQPLRAGPHGACARLAAQKVSRNQP